MKEIVIISGKGGTGKTVLTAGFATLAKRKVMADCDVDAADLHLILTPQIRKKEDFYGGRVPVMDESKCDECGACQEVCRFDAIHSFQIDLIACDGCGVCAAACPNDAIQMEENLCGEWFISDTRYGPMTHARLGIAEENSGKLVTAVRQQAKSIAQERDLDFIIVDGPPGIGCPVIASITGVDLVLVVTEPTISGIHDLERVLGVARHFGIPGVVCINKYDINLENSGRIREYCEELGVEVVGEIPYDPRVTKAMVNAKSVIEYPCGAVTTEVEKMWEGVKHTLEG